MTGDTEILASMTIETARVVVESIAEHFKVSFSHRAVKTDVKWFKYVQEKTIKRAKIKGTIKQE